MNSNGQLRAEPVYLLREPKNRGERRKFYEELAKNIKRLKLIDIDFLTEIFDEDNTRKYDEMYNEYKERYDKEFINMKRLKMFKYTIPNQRYFPLIYKSVLNK